MNTNELLPLLRGAILARTRTPVVLLPTDGLTDHELEVAPADAAQTAESIAEALPRDLELPTTLRLRCGDVDVAVEAVELPGAAPVPGPKDPQAALAATRAAVVAGRIALVTSGRFELDGDGDVVELLSGQAVFVPAHEPVTLRGEGQLFVAAFGA